LLESFIKKARRILGESRVITEEDYLEAYARDYWPYLVLKELTGIGPRYLPSAALLPETEDEVLEIVKIARDEGVKLVPYAGGSGVLGGTLCPEKGFVVIDLGRMNWIDWFDEDAGIVDVGPGALLSELEAWLNSRGKTLRHFPQSFPEAMIGGLVATRSTGQYSTGYGGIERMVKGLHVVVPTVGLIRVPPAPRRSFLYPLDQLFIGSEGTLGIITRVYLEAVDVPEEEEKVSWKCKDFKTSLELAKVLVRKNLAPELLRVYDVVESFVNFEMDGSVSLGIVEGVKDLVEHRLNIILNEVRSKNCELLGTEPVERWLSERFAVIKMIRSLLDSGLGFDTIEVSATWGKIMSVYNSVVRSLSEISSVHYVGTHSGHFYYSGAALYFTIVFDLKAIDKVYDIIWDSVMKNVNKYGGSISHHHGVGSYRWRWAELEYGVEGIKAMEMIKSCLDPEGVMRDRLPFRLRGLK
jgi:alkyldihydroxyacetonephosphate synthase